MSAPEPILVTAARAMVAKRKKDAPEFVERLEKSLVRNKAILDALRHDDSNPSDVG